MAKRNKIKSARPLLKLEALEQRQLLAGGFTAAQGTEYSNIVHANGNVYDQVLMKTSAISVSNDAGQITRVSFLDLQGDIVQAEFSGAGTLSISLDSATGPAAPTKYNQPGVQYMSGLASFTIQGSDSTTNFSAFTVGSATAHNGALNSIFDGGLTGGNNTADVARLTIVANPANPNGSTFGGIRAGNAIFSGSSGVVGIAASNIQVQDVVILGDINATGTAVPTLVFGTSSQFGPVTVAGGGLVSANGAAINNTGSVAYGISLDAGTNSAGTADAAETTSSSLSFTGTNPFASVNKIFGLTTGVDSGSAFTGLTGTDTFNADLSTGGTNTLNVLDQLNGGTGTDTLMVALAASVTPTALTSIELISATATATATLGLANATSVTSVTNSSSTAALTVSGIAAGASLSVSSVASQTTDFGYLSTSGTQSVALAVSGVTGGTAAEITIAGVETVTTTSSGTTNSYELKTAAATTLNFAGAVAQTVVLDATTLSVTKFDASAATAAVTLTTIDQTAIASGATVVSVLGGSGSDVLTLVESNNLSVDTGSGNDSVTIAAIDLDDTVAGGAGNDTLSTVTAQANVLDAATPTTYTVSGIEYLTVTDLFDGDLITGNIDTGIIRVTLGYGGTATAIATGGDDTVTGGAGTFDVYLGKSAAGNTAVLTGALVIADTGSATTDSLTVSNKAVNSTTGLNINAFGAVALTSTGYENVTINSGAVSGGAEAEITTLTITPDAIAANVSLTLTGTNAVDISTSLTTTSTGLLTVDGSGLTAQTAGTTTLDINTVAMGSGGTLNITGSGGDDAITTGVFKSTIVGGLGQDTITGSTAIDSIDGGLGNDTIVGGGGNDTLLGNGGNDLITVAGTSVSVDGGDGDDVINMDSTLSSGDTVAGGADVDTLALDAATTAENSQGVTGFEVLRADTALTQDMVQFTANSGFTKLSNNVAGAVEFTNVSSSVTTVTTVATSTTTVDRLLDNSSNQLTVSLLTAVTTTALTALDEETLNISSSSTGAVILSTLTVSDLTTLNITGAGAVTVTTLTGATKLATLNASAATAAVSIDGNTSTANMTATGSATVASTLVGGSGNDVVTGGTAADSLTGGGGADTISGGDGADSLLGGTGADSITGGEGADSITGGTGNDTIVLTETTSAIDKVILATAATNGVDTITGFAVGVDTITFQTADTTVVTTAGTAVFATGAATLVTSATYVANAIGSTTTSDVLELTGLTSANGDLGAATDGTELFKLLGTADSAATSITVTADEDAFFIIAYDNGNAYLYNAVDSDDADLLITASEVKLVSIITGITANAFASGDILTVG